MNKKALLIIDPQNDYFPDGAFPLWNVTETFEHIKEAIKRAQSKDIEIILVQHVASPENGPAPFFNADTPGVELHPELLKLVPESEIIIKSYADSFEQTNLEVLLQKKGITELMLCGMMTQNCVNHTALSKAAEKYQLSILRDCCTTTDRMIHLIALRAIEPRVNVTDFANIL